MQFDRSQLASDISNVFLDTLRIKLQNRKRPLKIKTALKLESFVGFILDDAHNIQKPTRKYGNPKKQTVHAHRRGGEPESSETSLKQLSHPSRDVEQKVRNEVDYNDPLLGGTSGGVPLTRIGLPATKKLLESGTQTHQRLGKISTNTWGSEPFAGYKWDHDEDTDTD